MLLERQRQPNEVRSDRQLVAGEMCCIKVALPRALDG
jgi:hypothetical protein